MKKIVVVIVALAACMVVALWGKNWSVTPDAIVGKVTRVQNQALKEAREKIEVYRANVKNAQSGYNKTMRLIESTKERQAEADAIVVDCEDKLQFIKDRMKDGKPILTTDGSQLSNEELDVEIERFGLRRQGAKEAARSYAAEVVELTKTSKTFEDWAVSGPNRLEALETKYKNTEQLFKVQLERLTLLEDKELVDVKKAYKEACGVVDEARSELIQGGLTGTKIDFQTGNAEISKKESQIQSIDAWLGKTNAADESRQVSFE